MVETALWVSLTREQRDFLHGVPDDAEEAPWMVMGDAQFWAAGNLASSLDVYVQRQGWDWYVGGMLPILYPDPETGRQKQVAPDVLVARVPRRPRQSYDLVAEGVFPQFVVEVVSPDSGTYDEGTKRPLYALLGAQEYVLYAPRIPGVQATRLWGYRRTAGGDLAPWLPDELGRLWSTELGLWLVAQEREIRAALPNGTLLPTLWESEQAREEAEQARQEAERRAREDIERVRRESEQARHDAERRAAAAQAEAEAAQARATAAETEVERLRAELERYRAGGPDISPGGSLGA